MTLWLRFSPWLGDFHRPWMWPPKKFSKLSQNAHRMLRVVRITYVQNPDILAKASRALISQNVSSELACRPWLPDSQRRGCDPRQATRGGGGGRVLVPLCVLSAPFYLTFHLSEDPSLRAHGRHRTNAFVRESRRPEASGLLSLEHLASA